MRHGTILGVWAHPDDETYLTAGLMARAVREGERVVCITATRGEGGSMDSERWPPERMGEIREAELMRSLEILGVTEHVFLGYPDIDMDTPLPDEGLDAVVAMMEEVRPDTVLTFGPEGMTGHEAHKSVSAWAARAFDDVAKPGAKLYYATYPPGWVEEWAPRLEPFNVFRPGTPPVHPRDRLAIDLDLADDLLDLKVRAITAHESQVGGLVHAFGEDDWRRAMSGEYFRLGAEKP